MSLSPSSSASCPVPRCHCRRSITSPCVPLLSCTSIAPGVVFFIQLTRSRHNFTQSSFPDKLFRSREEPVLFFFLLPACIFQLFWKRGGACPGRQQCQGCQEPRPAQQWLCFFFNPVLVQDKPRHQKLDLPCQHSALLFQDGM